MRKPNPCIFREYDIRGCYGETLHDADAYFIGRSYSKMLPENARISVAYDGRHSSPALAEQVIKGLTDSGMQVINLGLLPSPALYFSVFELGTDGGIMVTASHNPAQDNGFKFMLGKDAMHGEQIASLAVEGHESIIDGQGGVENVDIRWRYINHILFKLVSCMPEMRIAWDAANGAMGEVLDMATSQMLENGQGGHFLINADIDGDFPSHPADPTILANNKQLIETVLEDGCDVGFGFDGDGDRLGVIDEKGRMLGGDQLLAILASDVLEKYPAANIIADMKSSDLFAEEIERLGGKPVLWKTGHSLIKAKMKELDAPLAGEMSAHIFYKDNFGYDDALYAAIQFLNIMNKTGKKASELLDALPRRFSSDEIRIAVDEGEKLAIVEQVKAQLLADGISFQDTDGVRAQLEQGWWLLRASNTGANLVVRYEAKSESCFGSVESSLKSYLKIVGIEEF